MDEISGGAACSAAAPVRALDQLRHGGRSAVAAIDRDRYDVIPIGITRDGAFDPRSRTIPDSSASTRHALPEVVGQRHPRAPGRSRRRSREFTRAADGVTRRSLGDVDVGRSPSCTGRFGEDGTVQGAPRARRPAVRRQRACSPPRSAWTSTTPRSVLEAAGIAVAPWVTVTPARLGRATRDAGSGAHRGARPAGVREAGARGIVRRRHQGARTGPTWMRRCEIAFAEDTKALVESAVVGREVECARARRAADGGPTRVSVAGEIVHDRPASSTTSSAKYLDGEMRRGWCAPPTSRRASSPRCSGVAARAFEGDRRRRASPRRLLLHRHGVRGERAQHDARLQRRSRCSRSAGLATGMEYTSCSTS